MLKTFFYLGVFAACAVSLIFVSPSSAALFALLTGVMAGAVLPLADSALSSSRYFRLLYYSIQYSRTHIRVSVSYLFRIKVDNSYLLVKSTRWGHYQPVGGVYKISAGAKQKMEEIGAVDDNLVPIDKVSEQDLRIRIPGHKLVSFVRWFESGRSRETSSWREFYEELIKPGILTIEDFPYIFSDFIRRDITPIRFSRYAQSMEIFIVDILELLPTPTQAVTLRRIKDSGNLDVLWATEDQIRRLGAEPGKGQQVEIGEPAIWVL